ncbi:hypothetical protein A374_14750 [Fictibacillus macauensis ZFHKF-1]|uniref:Uncharacterized protein n=1 Tax=Fictibacillus macauensis ZFHKF-1 TaxID=1196324 RepID=I8IYP4_9BACL|nr:hypothetical protein [Fictibacillus macauensis]EIT84596.1 hypothetical protein A374_14750 [Fictibacillus macauensis ZFHKF-1]
MTGFIVDLILLALFVIGLTAFMGIITHTFSLKVFGRKASSTYIDQTKAFRANWSDVKRKDR